MDGRHRSEPGTLGAVTCTVTDEVATLTMTTPSLTGAARIALREASFQSEDLREGVRAFGQKRPARWKGR